MAREMWKLGTWRAMWLQACHPEVPIAGAHGGARVYNRRFHGPEQQTARRRARAGGLLVMRFNLRRLALVSMVVLCACSTGWSQPADPASVVSPPVAGDGGAI